MRPSIPIPHVRRGTALIAVALLAASGTSPRAADPQPYTVTIAPTGDAALDSALRDSSDLVSLREKAPVAPFALITRAQQDQARLAAALGSFGHYAGRTTMHIAGRALDDPGLPDALQSVPAGTAVPVTVAVDPGPLFHLRHVAIQGAVPEDVRAKLAPLAPGAPAVAADVLAVQDRLLTALREDGYALAKVSAPDAVEFASQHALDVTWHVEAGPRVDIGPISITGLQRVNEGFVRRRLLLHQGEQYAPSTIEAARDDLASLGVFQSVDARTPDHLDAAGQLPLTFAVRERRRHAVAVTGAYSTDQGIQGSVSWTHRNLFGNAEQLTFSAANTQLGGSASRQPGYNIGAQFIKPDFLHRDQALQIDLNAIRESIQAYDRTAAVATATVSRKISKLWTASLGLFTEVERVAQESVARHYTLVGLPAGVKYDSANSLLDPTSGIRASATVTPIQAIPAESDSRSATFVLLQLAGATYLDVGGMLGGRGGRSILALRGQVNSAEGATLSDLPPDKRFYAGGSATVRGYKYLSVGPLYPDRKPIGGLSLTAATVEFRQRILQSFGFAAFVDGAQVGRTPAPFTGTARVGAGLGLRYFTPIGPIRADFAVPLNRQAGDDQFEFYIGLGEAF